VLLIDPPAPHVHDHLALEGDGERRADLGPGVEVARERIAQSGELIRAAAVYLSQGAPLRTKEDNEKARELLAVAQVTAWC
jgi:hypothetical protein